MTSPIDEILDKPFKKFIKDLTVHRAIQHLKKIGVTAKEVDAINQSKLAGDTNLPGVSLLEKWFRNDESRPFSDDDRDIEDLTKILDKCLQSLRRCDETKLPITCWDGADRIIEEAEQYVDSILNDKK
jgi:hypothetical protein